MFEGYEITNIMQFETTSENEQMSMTTAKSMQNTKKT
jgi:hypothetical protein